MKYNFLFIVLFFLFSSCAPTVVKTDFDFSEIKTISVATIRDFDSFPGSGEIISRSLIHHLLRIGINVVEREKLEWIFEEIALSQSAVTSKDYEVNIASPDAILFCTINNFTDRQVIVIPITTEDKGHTVTTVEEKSEPVVVEGKDKDKDKKEIEYKTTVTEKTTHYEGSITESERVEYINSVVGITLQLINKKTGEVLWSSNYWYNALTLPSAVDRCVAGAIKTLKKIIQ